MYRLASVYFNTDLLIKDYDVYNSFKDRIQIDTLYEGLAKVFDRVNYGMLSGKLEYFGIIDDISKSYLQGSTRCNILLLEFLKDQIFDRFCSYYL